MKTSKAPSGMTFVYGQVQWPNNWFTVEVSNVKTLPRVKQHLTMISIIRDERQKGVMTLLYCELKENKTYWGTDTEIKRKFPDVNVLSHYHTKPKAIRTDTEKAWIKAQREERKRRAPIVFGVPYIRKQKYWGGNMTEIIVFYKQVKGRFCALRAEMFEGERDSDVPAWRLTRYGCHEVKKILEECKVQDLSFVVKHGSLVSKVSQVVEEQLSIWNLIKEVMDRAPRTATGRAEELAKYEKGTECPASTESTASP